MRISTSENQRLGINAILEQQAKLSQTQLKLSSGKRILTPSEDPVAAARLVDLNHVIEQTKQFQDNIGTAKHRLSLEEVSIRSAVNIFHRLKELAVQGLNDINTLSDRGAIATEFDELNDQLLSIANTKNANGEYVFSGYLTQTQPFVKTAGVPNTYVYQGDSNQRSIQIGPSRQVTDGDPGEAVFGTMGTDNVFESIENFSQGLKTNNPLGSFLTELDAALEKIVTVEASVGARRLAIDRQEGLNADFILDMESVISETEDLDYASAISEFNIQTVSLQAAQQAYARVQNLSLFNFL
jgi:flagellar hook-associated protein 3 FlgL